MTSVSWRVPAKINLSLAVGPRRPDGYHDLSTVFHAISLADVVTASTPTAPDADPSLTIVEATGAERAVDLAAVPLDRSNLAVRAAQMLAAHAGRRPSVDLHVSKAIPVAGGLAGGSADAAGALLACNDLWNLGLSTADLCRLAADLGSDVPFAVVGGTALGAGRGEVLEPLPARGRWHWVLIAGVGGLSTPTVYRRLDELRATGQAPPPRDRFGPPSTLIAALADGDVSAVADALDNDLQAAAFDLAPSLAATVDAGRAAGLSAGLVSGSGPTCVFLASNAEQARTAAAVLERDGFAGRVMIATGSHAPHRLR